MYATTLPLYYFKAFLIYSCQIIVFAIIAATVHYMLHLVRIKLISYPYPLPFFPGFVRKFFPEGLYFSCGFSRALNDVTGPAKVPKWLPTPDLHIYTKSIQMLTAQFDMCRPRILDEQTARVLFPPVHSRTSRVILWQVAMLHALANNLYKLLFNKYLLHIPRQLTWMKRGLYQPIQSYMCKKGSYMSLA